jgi:AcrR family transcriptional regulator
MGTTTTPPPSSTVAATGSGARTGSSAGPGTGSGRPRRADAQRNRDRILVAAAEAFAEHGPNLALDEIARRAGVSPATLFRHVANRDELVGAVVERRFADEVEPRIVAALEADDAWGGLEDVIAATVGISANGPAWRETMAMAKELGLVSSATRDRFRGSLAELLDRARAQGTVRDGVDASDLAPVVTMLRSLVAAGVDEAGWRRYLRLLLRAEPSVRPDQRGVRTRRPPSVSGTSR